ncbi:hypothetical protein VC191_09525 [Citrobacter koseri]|uniref:hypothetical protein n=1 Tax=Citrobacter koseri TaxID=545 RepID=UPI002B3D661E|nr:hypothetical protein [Citrobacter koseri]MEB2704033.1 hypothetical protein [Citrobacter koseri]MEB2709586.1 hypothetical protein [Citrobacter koseri]
MKKDPLNINVSDGLGKMFEAAELIPEEKKLELAEKAKYEASKSKKESRKINKIKS